MCQRSVSDTIGLQYNFKIAVFKKRETSKKNKAGPLMAIQLSTELANSIKRHYFFKNK